VKKKTIVYISLDGMTDPLGQSQVLPYLKGLSDEYSIYLISSEKPERFNLNGNTIKEQCKQYAITWIPLLYKSGNLWNSAIYNPLQLSITTFKTVIRTGACIIHCRSYVPALIGLIIAKFKNRKLLFDMRGFWADERVDGNIWNLKTFKGKALYKLFKHIEKVLIKKSDAIITLTYEAKKEIEQWPFYNKQVPITVIPCCVDTHHFITTNNTVKTSVYHQLNISPNALVVTYLGSLGTWYMATEMMQFFYEQYKINTQSVFLILTPDSKETIYKYAQQQGVPLQNIRVYYAQRQEVPKLLSITRYALFFIKPLFSKKASSPTKLAELMAMGIPVVTNAGIGDVDKIINETQAGILINEFSTSEYQRAIKLINEQLFNKQALRSSCIEHFSLTNGVKKYKQVYQYLCP
jgi:glycosyltransferase involved in cell wall biosynthesis